jgi:hypothetical protein
MKQDTRFTYNVTMKRVYETIVAVQKQSVLHNSACTRACGWMRRPMEVCVRECSLTNPGCKTRVPYYICRLCPLCLHHIFRHFLMNGTIFGKNQLNTNCVFIFSISFSTFPILRRIQRDIVHKRKSLRVKYCCPLFFLDFN